MSAIVVRQSGGANIISLPKAIVKTLGLYVDSKIDLSLENNKIVLTPIVEALSLENLLLGSHKSCFIVTDEDREWIDSTPAGK